MDKDTEVCIDLGRLMRIMVAHKAVISGIIAASIAIAAGIAFVLPKQYESTSVVQIRNVAMDANTTAANMVAHGLNRDDGSRIDISPLTYTELMKSRAVMEAAAKRSQSMAKEMGIAPVEIRSFHVENKRGTNLLVVTGIGQTPVEAQLIAKCLIDGFVDVQTKKKQETQTQFIQVINERIEVARQEGKQEVYKYLQRLREEQKIQLAMPSMNIQIIDSPTLPAENEPTAPRKSRIFAIGFMFGGLFSLGYGLYRYRREEDK